MPLHTFRYACCGGFNTVVGLSVYYIFLYYVFENLVVDLGFFAFKPHSAALLGSFVVSFILGFLLNKYVVFTNSRVRSRIQLFRYFLSILGNLVINYLLLKLLVELLHFEPFTAQVLTSIVVVSVGYITQRHFTFRTVANKR